MIRPSSLPMLAKCPRFNGGAPRDYTESGTLRHKLLAERIAGRPGDPTGLDDADVEGVEWAVRTIHESVTYPDDLRVEEKVKATLLDWSTIEGTADVWCVERETVLLFDFKWRPRDYSMQLAAYALALMERVPGAVRVDAYALFGATRTRQHYRFDWDAAITLVSSLVEKARDPNAKPAACDYCSWCARAPGCPALLEPARTVAAGYAEEEHKPAVENWHPSQMTTPEELAAALSIKRAVIDPWCESLEFHAMQRATKDGWQLPGFTLKETTGRSYVSDVAAAFAALGLPQDRFLSCCDVRMSTSKDYPDKAGVVDVYRKEKAFTSRAAAEREVKAKLGDIVKAGNSGHKLVKTKE